MWSWAQAHLGACIDQPPSLVSGLLDPSRSRSLPLSNTTSSPGCGSVGGLDASSGVGLLTNQSVRQSLTNSSARPSASLHYMKRCVPGARCGCFLGRITGGNDDQPCSDGFLSGFPATAAGSASVFLRLERSPPRTGSIRRPSVLPGNAATAFLRRTGSGIRRLSMHSSHHRRRQPCLVRIMGCARYFPSRGSPHVTERQ